MGMHRFEITMTGGHGCDRDAKEDEALKPPCDNPSCPDCRFRKLVEEFKTRGAFGYPDLGPMADGKTYEHGAVLIHWPGTAGEVVDDLVKGTRKKGQF